MGNTYNKIKRAAALGLSAALLAALLSGCFWELDIESPAEQAVEGSAVGEEMAATYAGDRIFSLNCVKGESFSPFGVTSSWNQLVGQLVYEPLFTVDADFEAAPLLVTDYSTADGQAWTFHVDTGRTFHTGEGLTAWDAVYSIRRGMSSGVYGAKLSGIYGISAVDEGSFIVNLKEPNYLFYKLLDIPVVRDGTADETAPAGTGPYMFDAALDKLSLYSAHPQSADMPIDAIYLKEYVEADDIISAFTDSYIDVVVDNPNNMATLGYGTACVKKYYDTTCMHYLGFNTESAFTRYSRFCYAMNFIIDREKIVSESMSGCGLAANLPASPAAAVYPRAYAATFAYSREKALEAFAAAGVSDTDADGQLELTVAGSAMDIDLNFIVCGDSQVKVAAARRIADALRDIGIPVTLRELGYDSYLAALEAGDFDIYYAEVKLCSDFDLSYLLGAEGALNYGKIRDPSYLNYISQYLSAPEADRQMRFDFMCKYIAETAPIVTIAFEKAEMITHRGVVTGHSPTQSNLFNDFAAWEIELDP